MAQVKHLQLLLLGQHHQAGVALLEAVGIVMYRRHSNVMVADRLFAGVVEALSLSPCRGQNRSPGYVCWGLLYPQGHAPLDPHVCHAAACVCS